jgi:ribonuclease HI
MPIRVYCDGACRPNPGSAFIGVYCEQPRIEICRHVDGFTNNAAECLAVIAGLEECKRLNLTGVEILTDSQTVCQWVGGGRWNSDAPYEYVPTIRDLLKEANATLVWIPGKQNKADKLSKRLRPRDTDKELINLKVGRDAFSAMPKQEVIGKVGEAWETISKRLDKEKYQLSAARWFLRGLPLEAAIRKVEATRAQGHEINFRRRMRYSDD